MSFLFVPKHFVKESPHLCSLMRRRLTATSRNGTYLVALPCRQWSHEVKPRQGCGRKDYNPKRKWKCMRTGRRRAQEGVSFAGGVGQYPPMLDRASADRQRSKTKQTNKWRFQIQNLLKQQQLSTIKLLWIFQFNIFLVLKK